MSQEENTVDVGMPELSAADDAQQAVDGEITATPEEQPGEAQQQPEREDAGWFKQRISKAVDKAVAEAEARMAAKYEAQIAALNEERLERQAQALVSRGEVKSLEMAKEYLRLKGGEQQQESEQPQAEESKDDPVIQAKADMLARQANKIKAARGLDVMAAYNSDQEIQRKIASGEWDFYDVADNLDAGERHTPVPARASNGAKNEPVSIRNMTEAQWKEFNKKLDHGGRFRAR